MENPSCMCQRSMICAGVLPCASAIFLITGSLNRAPSLVALPKVNQHSTVVINMFVSCSFLRPFVCAKVATS